MQLTVNKIAMTGFEPQVSGVGSNRSINSATTIAQVALVCTETTVNSDRPLMHYPPISDLFVNKEYFSTLHK